MTGKIRRTVFALPAAAAVPLSVQAQRGWLQRDCSSLISYPLACREGAVTALPPSSP